LLPLDKFLLFRRQLTDPPFDAGPQMSTAVEELVTLLEYRKLDVLVRRLAVLFGQVAGDVIQRRAELVKGLSYPNGDEWRRNAEHVGFDAQVERIGLEISDNSALITFHEPLDILLNVVQMGESPIQLEPDPPPWVVGALTEFERASQCSSSRAVRGSLCQALKRKPLTSMSIPDEEDGLRRNATGNSSTCRHSIVEHGC
jgi:hypothetical protein